MNNISQSALDDATIQIQRSAESPDAIQLLRVTIDLIQSGQLPAPHALRQPEFRELLMLSLQLLLVTCHSAARTAGWWNDPKTGNPVTDNPLCFSNKVALIHSEVSEAMEGDRKGLNDDKLPQYPMRTVELGDALIRILDTAGGFNLDLASATVYKMLYNLDRADHKIEARKADDGKAY